MKLKINGELPIFNSLIEAVRKEICNKDPWATLEVRLADDDNHGNALVFRWGVTAYARVTFLHWEKDQFAFRVMARTVGSEWREETCVFPHLELDRGIRALAALLPQRIFGYLDLFEQTAPTFEHYFEEAKKEA